MIFQKIFTISTYGRGMTDITNPIAEVVKAAKITDGLCNVFIHHTSASILISENADISVQNDLESFMQRLVPDGDKLFSHVAEGPDDMPSHVRSILTASTLSIPVTQTKLALGAWQGIYLWEHRFANHDRKITVSVLA